VIGVILLLMTLLLSYTGYLLPWDQLAYWAITVGSNIASAVPIMGNKIRFLMLGGNAVNGQTHWLRFYVLHCMILPLAACFSSQSTSGAFARTAASHSHASEPATVRAKASPAVTREGGAIIMADSKRFHSGRRVQREEVSAPELFSSHAALRLK